MIYQYRNLNPEEFKELISKSFNELRTNNPDVIDIITNRRPHGNNKTMRLLSKYVALHAYNPTAFKQVMKYKTEENKLSKLNEYYDKAIKWIEVHNDGQRHRWTEIELNRATRNAIEFIIVEKIIEPALCQKTVQTVMTENAVVATVRTLLKKTKKEVAEMTDDQIIEVFDLILSTGSYNK